MVETKFKEIDGARYGVSQLPAMRGLRMFNRLTRVLGPALTKAAAADGLGSLPDALLLLTEKLSDDELEAITRELLYNATQNEAPLMSLFDTLMAGKTGTVLKLLAFAVEVNYASFFDALRSAVGKRLAAVKVAGQPGSTSPGSESQSGQPGA